MHSHLSALLRFAPLSLAFTALACGGGGGGGGGAVGSETLNEGIYDTASFNYVDPMPPTYHPLVGKPSYALVRRDEVANVVGASEPSFMLDDAKTYADNGVSYPTIPASATAGMTLLNTANGDVDGNGSPDLVVLGRIGAEGNGVFHVNVLTIANGQWVLIGSFDVNSPGDHIENDSARVQVGDVDGDNREEIIVAGVLDQFGWIRIYEDPVQGGGFGVLGKEIAIANATEVKAVPAQLDLDSEMELVVFVNPKTGDSAAYVLDDAAHDYVAMSSTPLFSDATVVHAEIVPYQRDSDAPDEIAVICDKSNGKLDVRVFDDADAAFAVIKTYGQVSAGITSMTNPMTSRRAKAGDIDGDGIDELVVQILKQDGSDYTLIMRTYWGNGTVSTKEYGFSTSVPKSWDLAFADRNSDGDMELVVGYETTTNGSGTTRQWLRVEDYDSDPSNASHLEMDVLYGSFPLSAPTPLFLTANDFDLDGVRMRWKGVKFQQLPNPTVLVVLAAPPTKKGISQNYDGSEMSYTTTQGTETAYETTWGSSWSLSLGFEFEDPLGLNEASAKATLKKGFETGWKLGASRKTSTTFQGGCDQDVVIFSGPLHMIYEYEWVAAADPRCIGTVVSINVVLDTKIYKWTRKFFEDTFGSKSPLPSDLFGHAIGNPATYPTHADAQALLKTYDGGEGTSVTVGQGTGANGLELEMELVLENTNTWTTEVEVEAEGKIAGITFGAATSITNETVWTTSTSKSTTFGGQVGDILQGPDYHSWQYETGIFIYRRPDKDGNLFQVLNFWTNPMGASY